QPAASVPVSMAAQPNGPVAQLAPQQVDAGVVTADVGQGRKTPATINFRLNLSDVPGFKVQASTPGTPAKTKADLTDIKFYLVESTTGAAPTALAGTGFTYTISATNRTNNRVDVTFTNVAPNAAGKSYYVVVGGFKSATYTAAENITNLAAPINDATEGKYYISNTGGNADGSVSVATDYSLNNVAALAVPLKLLNAVSPVIDSDVNVTAGDEVNGGALAGSGS
ncbi:MAG: hypothetical protein ACK46X_11570, partial [Candidatus Sericytochromatia bacterium]